MRTMLFNAHLCWLLVFGGSTPLRRRALPAGPLAV